MTEDTNQCFKFRVKNEDKEVTKNWNIHYGEVPLPNVNLTFKSTYPISSKCAIIKKKEAS